MKPHKDIAQFAGLCSLCLIVLGVVYWLWHHQIEENRSEYALRQLQELLPSHQQRVLTQDAVAALRQHRKLMLQGCGAYSEFTYQLLLKTEQGYAGPLRVLVSLELHQGHPPQIFGVRVLPPFQETPGLGDVISLDKSPWLRQFDTVPLNGPLDTFDAFSHFDTVSGATISTSAVIRAVTSAIRSLTHQQEVKGDFANACSDSA